MAEPDTDVRIVHRDGALLVLDKPSGIATTSPAGGHSLVAVAGELDAEAPNLHPTSRLDAEVSGLVTFARTRAANQGLIEARAQGRYARAYLALSARPPEPEAGTWSWALGIDPRDRRRRVVVEEGASGKGVRDAVTDYRTLSVTPHAALLWLEPRTGRTHQLRVHAERAGVPLLGDKHYGGERRRVLPSGSVASLRRVMLHCTRIELPDLGGDARAAQARLRLESLPRQDFRRAWDALGGASLAESLP